MSKAECEYLMQSSSEKLKSSNQSVGPLFLVRCTSAVVPLHIGVTGEFCLAEIREFTENVRVLVQLLGSQAAVIEQEKLKVSCARLATLSDHHFSIWHRQLELATS
jgi:hypothetical protein